MNNKITFPRLAALLADKSGRSKRFSEDFLRETFALISERLEAGESVKVKSLGTFRLSRVEPRKSVDVTTGQPMEISGHSKVVFSPAKELAEAINAPFDAFSAVEIGDNVNIESLIGDDEIIVQDDSEDILLASGVSSENEDLTPPAEEESLVQISEEYVEPKEEAEPKEYIEPKEEGKPKEDLKSEQYIKDIPEAYSHNDLTDNYYSGDEDDVKAESDSKKHVGPKVMTNKTSLDDDDDIFIVNEGPVRDSRSFDRWNDSYGKEQHKTNWLKTIMIWSACALLGIVITFVIWSLATRPDFSDTDNDYRAESVEFDESELIRNAQDDPVPPSDEDFSIEQKNEEIVQDPVPTAPSDAVVYDTIGKSRYLTTMAKDHYGNNKFWPYIYEENKNHIGHPDKIRPGTPIVIPKLSKYGVDPSNPDDAEKANKLGAEIYARYGKTL